MARTASYASKRCKMKQYKYYYYDEQNDDFANNGIDGKPTPDNFPYIPTNPFYRFFKPIVYYFFVGVFGIVVRCMGVKFVNRKVLKEGRARGQGYFLYGNHTSWIPDTVSAAMVAFPKTCYTIANPDAISIKGAGMFIRMLGAYPTPNNKQNYANFWKGVDRYYKRGCAISIFPEAHIWPYYNQIRNFPVVSFTFPVKLDAPCYTKTLVYKETKKGKIKPYLYFDGPFYPNKELPAAEAKQELRDRIHDQMVKRVTEEGSVLKPNYEYIRVNTPEEMRSEITDN